jgi:site-specific recombinase XerD
MFEGNWVMKLEQTLNDFLLACRADGLSDRTVKWYRSIVAAFVATCPGVEMATITTRQMREYIAGLRSRDRRYVDAANKPEQVGGLAVHSIASHVTALHRFWAWCADEYDIDNPMRRIKRHKPTKRLPTYIHPQDFVRLFHACEQSKYPERDRAILAFLADTGCRVGGLVSLTVTHLDIDKRRALVLEKGSQWRRVKYTPITARLLYQWLALRDVDGDSIFGLLESGVYQVLKRLKARTGITGRVNPHAFRHNFIQTYLKNGGDPFSLARLTGHKNVQTVMEFYAIFSDDDLGEMHDRHTPLHEMLGD